jgi:hypothetical protein
MDSFIFPPKAVAGAVACGSLIATVRVRLREFSGWRFAFAAQTDEKRPVSVGPGIPLLTQLKIDIDFCDNLNGLSIEQRGLITPFADCVQGGLRQQGVTTQHFLFDNFAIAINYDLQANYALNVSLFGFPGIFWINLVFKLLDHHCSRHPNALGRRGLGMAGFLGRRGTGRWRAEDTEKKHSPDCGGGLGKVSPQFVSSICWAETSRHSPTRIN